MANNTFTPEFLARFDCLGTDFFTEEIATEAAGVYNESVEFGLNDAFGQCVARLVALLHVKYLRVQAARECSERELDRCKKAHEEELQRCKTERERELELWGTESDRQWDAMERRSKELGYVRERLPQCGGDRRANKESRAVTSVADLCKRIEASSNTIQRNFRVTTPVLAGRLRTACKLLVDGKFNNEESMYRPLRDFLKLYIASFVKEGSPWVADTHENPFLDGRAPKLSIFEGSTYGESAELLWTPIEVKFRNDTLTKAAKGRLLDYLYRMSEFQAERTTFTGWLTNIKENVFITLDRSPERNDSHTIYHNCSFRDALAFMVEILSSDAERPRRGPFSRSLGDWVTHLGSGAGGTVAKFQLCSIPDDMIPVRPLPAGGLVAVKSLRVPGQHDIPLLLQIARGHGRPSSIPELVFYSEYMDQFAISPVGQGMREEELVRRGTFAQHALHQIFDGLLWLHANDIIHRDLRLDNIVFDGAQAVIIDYGAAVILPAINIAYLGGFSCCPPRILSAFHERYDPRKEDDYHAFVLFVHSVHYPSSTRQFSFYKIADSMSDENARLRRFWRRLKVSTVWGNFVLAAERGDVKTLRTMADMVVTVE